MKEARSPRSSPSSQTGATAYLSAGSGVAFAHTALEDGDAVRLGNTEIRALSTPGHAAAQHAYVFDALVAGLVADAIGFSGAIAVVGAVTAASGADLALDCRSAAEAGACGSCRHLARSDPADRGRSVGPPEAAKRDPGA